MGLRMPQQTKLISKEITSLRLGLLATLVVSILLNYIAFPDSLLAQDTISISPTSGTVGSYVTITKEGLNCNFVAIYWDDQILETKVMVKDDGQLKYRFKVPPTPRGRHTIKIKQLGSADSNIASGVFTVVPHIEIFPDMGRGNIPVTITGSGFAPLEKDIKIFWNNNLVCSTNANHLGSWGVTFEAPAVTKGEHFISVIGSTTTAEEVGVLKFTVIPLAKAEPLSGPVGTEVKIRGVGFRTGEDGITITYDNEIIKCNIVGGPDGSWDTTITIPPSTAGYHTIGVYGSSFTPKGIVPDIQFKVTPSIELLPTTGNKGDRVTIKGTGFASNEEILINFGLVALGKATAADSGCFEFVFQVPQTSKGEHTVGVSGNSGNIAKATFTVAKEPPLAPEPIYPKNKEKVEIFGSITELLSATAAFLLHSVTFWKETPYLTSVAPGVELTWTDLPVDNSGERTYILQIGPSWDTDLDSPIVVKEHLTETKYECHLPPGYYTWQVKAVDDIDNESPWSLPAQFQIVVVSPYVLALALAIPLSVIGLTVWLWLWISRAT